MEIAVNDISKTFGRFKALDNISLLIPKGHLVALLGPSGSGKTTLLRIIAGLEQADPGPGSIRFSRTAAPENTDNDCRIGFVFQHYALFNHMTVFENIAFGLRVRPRRTRPSRSQIRRKVNELLHLIQLENHAEMHPRQLSGGQRQRVALARALAVEPQVLLLDEPFGALDAKVRIELRRWLRRLHDEIQLTSVFVTHDQDEALELADRVVVMNAGRIEQIGSPDDVFHHPRTEFVMSFLGQVNCFHGRLENGKAVFGPIMLEHGANDDLPENPDCKLGSQPARMLVRPHDLHIQSKPNGESAMPAKVRRIHLAGSQARMELESINHECIIAEMPYAQYRQSPFSVGARVYITIRNPRIYTRDENLTPPVTVRHET